jgi:hypothetical protein
MPLWAKTILAAKYEECAKSLQIYKDDYNLLLACSYLHHGSAGYARISYEILLNHISKLPTNSAAYKNFTTAAKKIIDRLEPLAFGSVRFQLVINALNQDDKLLEILNTHQWVLDKNETFKTFLPHYKSWIKDPSTSKIPNTSEFNVKLVKTVAQIDIKHAANCANKDIFCDNIFKKIFS